MDVFELQAKISVDTAPYLTALRAAASETERLRRTMSAPITPFGGSTPSTPGSGTGGGSTPSTPSTPTLPPVTNQAQEAGKAIDDLNKKLGEGFKAAAKVGAAAWGTFSAAAVAATKKAVDGFAQYEQLVGGVDTIFKESSQRVQEYAEQAYKTAGMSANQYMETVTGFSMSLLQGLEGDTEKAAEYADVAIRDMSDNANKMGTAMGSIQYAYQGFAKQNYTMLDNLKLGYGGTREEMERLLEDAGKLANTKFDISNYGDVIQAIHTIQENLGITGTTAKEASETIEGSMNSTKAAIDNLIVGFARSDADIDKLVDDVSDNIGNLAKNAIPVAERAFVAMSNTALKVGKEIADQLPSLIGRATEEIHQTIAEGFGDSADKIFAVETAIKAAAAGFITFKAAAYVADVVDKIKAVNTAMKGTVTLSEALKASNLANPYVLAATAIAAATVALKSYIDIQTDLIQETSDSYDLLNDRQKELVDGIRESSREMSESRKEWGKTTKTLEDNSALYKKLTSELYSLDEAENLSATEKERMKLIVGQLNSEIDGLNIQLDKENGKLLTQKSTIDALIASYEKQAKAKAYQERIYEVTKQQIDVEKNLNRVTREREGAYNTLSKLQLDYASKQREINDYAKNVLAGGAGSVEQVQEYEKLGAELDAIKAKISDQEGVVAGFNQQWASVHYTFVSNQEEVQKYTTALAGMGEQAKTTAEETGKAVEESAEKVAKSVGIIYDEESKSTEIYARLNGQIREFSEEQVESIAQILDAYDEMYNAQYKAIEKSVDLYEGFTADTSVTYNDLYNNLQESAFYLNDWTTAIDQLQAKVDKGLMDQEFLDSLKSMGLDSWSIVYDMNHATGDQLKNYSNLWVQTNQGIKESTDKLMQGQKETTERQLNQITGIANAKIGNYKHSMELLGAAGPDGFVKGFNEKLKEAKAAAGEGADEVRDEWAEHDETNSPSRKYAELGLYAVQGFADGMVRAEGIAENAARYVAVKAYNAMVEELDIHSPSKKMRKLGGFTGEGFALGISDKEADVLNAAHGLAESAVDPLNNLTPIVSKGGASGAYSGAQGTETPTYVFNLVTPDGTMVGRWLAPFIDAEQGQMIAFSQRGYAT